MFFEVIPTTVFRADGTLLTYQSDLPLRPGHLVLIPLGRHTTLGIVYRQVPAVSFKTRSILSLVHPTPLPSHLLKAALWLSSYYLSPLPTVAKLLLPATLTPSSAAKLQPAKNLSSLQNLIKHSLKNPQNPARASKIASKVTLAANLGPTAPPPKIPLITLNPAQKHALEAIKNAPRATRLLRGVTGSGKTHIYLQMASEALRAQKSVILLVPEIALTSQIVQVFQQTFGDRITLLHSQQTPATRRRLWLSLLESTTPTVVIGPRSALFAPVHDLGLILIDEAHESSYYQENSPRYSALRLASQIAGTLKLPCVLGSATPNLVDYYLARQNSALVTLDHKAKAAAQQVENAQVETVTDVNGLQAVKVTFDSGILFNTSSSALSSNATASLAKFASTVLNPNKDMNVDIKGYTDNTGWKNSTAAESVQKNINLSMERANSVANYLKQCGVAATQIASVEGLGEANPVADNSTETGRQQNRRVEVYLTASQAMIEAAQAEAGGN